MKTTIFSKYLTIIIMVLLGYLMR